MHESAVWRETRLLGSRLEKGMKTLAESLSRGATGSMQVSLNFTPVPVCLENLEWLRLLAISAVVHL